MTVAEIIILTASYYRIPLSEPVLEMYCEDLEGLAPEAVIEAYKAFRRDPKNKTMPLPAQIRDMIEPTPSPDAEARELLGRIKNAIKQFGYMQAESARLYCGEVAWQLVREHGGWNHLCCNSDFLKNDSMQAQARNRLIDMIHYGPKLTLVVDKKIQISNEERFRIEADRQKEAYAEHIAKIEASKPDPNEEYLSTDPVERQKIIDGFLANIKKIER